MLSAALTAAPGAAANPSISVNDSRCGADVTVVAHNVPLSHVLSELGQALSFQVSVAAEADRNVATSLSGPVREVITALTRHDNVIYIERSDPACEALRRPVRITVLEGRAPAPGEMIVEAPLVAPGPALTPPPRSSQTRLARSASQQGDEKDESAVRRPGGSGQGVPRRQR